MRSELAAVFEYGLVGALVWQLYAVFGDDTGIECAHIHAEPMTARAPSITFTLRNRCRPVDVLAPSHAVLQQDNGMHAHHLQAALGVQS